LNFYTFHKILGIFWYNYNEWIFYIFSLPLSSFFDLIDLLSWSCPEFLNFVVMLVSLLLSECIISLTLSSIPDIFLLLDLVSTWVLTLYFYIVFLPHFQTLNFLIEIFIYVADFLLQVLNWVPYFSHLIVWMLLEDAGNFLHKIFEFFVYYLKHFRVFCFSYWLVGSFWRSHVALPFHIFCVSALWFAIC
jgi:hypothetical protein